MNGLEKRTCAVVVTRPVRINSFTQDCMFRGATSQQVLRPKLSFMSGNMLDHKADVYLYVNMIIYFRGAATFTKGVKLLSDV